MNRHVQLASLVAVGLGLASPAFADGPMVDESRTNASGINMGKADSATGNAKTPAGPAGHSGINMGVATAKPGSESYRESGINMGNATKKMMWSSDAQARAPSTTSEKVGTGSMAVEPDPTAKHDESTPMKEKARAASTTSEKAGTGSMAIEPDPNARHDESTPMTEGKAGAGSKSNAEVGTGSMAIEPDPATKHDESMKEQEKK